MTEKYLTKKEQEMKLLDVVMKLIGPIHPIGESSEDDRRFKNLKALTNLIDDLLWQVDLESDCLASHEYSVKRTGEYCEKYLQELKNREV